MIPGREETLLRAFCFAVSSYKSNFTTSFCNHRNTREIRVSELPSSRNLISGSISHRTFAHIFSHTQCARTNQVSVLMLERKKEAVLETAGIRTAIQKKRFLITIKNGIHVTFHVKKKTRKESRADSN